MNPRRRVGWLSRVGRVIKPDNLGAVLSIAAVVMGAWAENRHHMNSVAAGVTDETKVLLARVISLERGRDSSDVRVRYLERQVRRLKRAQGPRFRGRVGPDLEPYGPTFEPEQRGTLLASIGKAFRRLFFLPG